MIFLVVDKVKTLYYGVFDNEQDAVKYMGGGDGVKIVYLCDDAVKRIKTLSETDFEMEGFKTYRHGSNPKEKEFHDRLDFLGGDNGDYIDFIGTQNECREHLKQIKV